MSGMPQSEVISHRRETVDEQEPLLESTVTVQSRGRGDGTPYVTPTTHGAEIVGFSSGDEVTVEIYRDGVFLRPSEE